WVTITSQEKCDQFIKHYHIGIRNFHICAGPQMKKTHKGTCVGDSGGPLMCNLRDGRWHLVGTLLWVWMFQGGFPDVYSRITYYLPWIRGKLGHIALTHPAQLLDTYFNFCYKHKLLPVCAWLYWDDYDYTNFE
ncbi:Serine protease 48, partial [Orchesella cincta]